jgi:ferrous iron transport protein A
MVAPSPSLDALSLLAAERTSDVVTLDLTELPLHQPATVVGVGGDRAFRRRLLELGLLPGTHIVLRNIAPLGDPLELELRGGRLSIRRAEAQRIQVSR